jgi:Sulfotransferase family
MALQTKGFTRFCICRSPWERFVSFWQNKGHGKIFLANGSNPFKEGMGFPRFVETALSIPDRDADRHYQAQTGFVFEGDTLLVDRVLRFENLETEWEDLRREFDLPALPHYKQTGAHLTYRSVFDEFPEARERVEERYRRDIEFFGYEY